MWEGGRWRWGCDKLKAQKMEKQVLFSDSWGEEGIWKASFGKIEGTNEKGIIKSRVRIACISQSSTLSPAKELQARLATVMSGNKKVTMTGPRRGRVEAGIKDVLEWQDALKGRKLIIRFLFLPPSLSLIKGADQREAVMSLGRWLSAQEVTSGWLRNCCVTWCRQ